MPSGPLPPPSAQSDHGPRWQYPPAYRPHQPPQSPPARPAQPAQPGRPSQPGPITDKLSATGSRLITSTPIVTAVGIGLGLLGIIVVLWFIWRETSTSATLVAFLAALIPLALVMACVLWLDRWEPEPRGVLGLAFLWGAGVSTASALGLNTYLSSVVHSATNDDNATQVIALSVIAPVVEESLKGAGLLMLFLWRRRFFDGPVDGVVYAATIAAGFAFSENILYFARGEMVASLGVVFFARAVISPFAHILFTTCMGLAIGLAAVRARRRTVAFLIFPIGWLAAVGLHGLWNFTSTLDIVFLPLYLLLQVPLFLGAITLAIWLRHQEKRVLRSRLSEYHHLGWFAPAEIAMLTSLRQRAHAKRWARRYGDRAHQAMAQFQRQSTRVALLRNRMVQERAPVDAQQRQQQLLTSIAACRQSFLYAAQGPIRPVQR